MLEIVLEILRKYGVADLSETVFGVGAVFLHQHRRERARQPGLSAMKCAQNTVYAFAVIRFLQPLAQGLHRLQAQTARGKKLIRAVDHLLVRAGRESAGHQCRGHGRARVGHSLRHDSGIGAEYLRARILQQARECFVFEIMLIGELVE